MNPRKIVLCRIPASLLIVLMTALTVAVPMLDRGTIAGHFVDGTEQSDPLASSNHDHRICVQYGANHLETIDVPTPVGPVETPLYFEGWTESVAPLPPIESLQFTRAPPVA